MAKKGARGVTTKKANTAKSVAKSSTKSKQESPSKLSMGVRNRLGEGLLILVGAIALYLLISLVTYHHSDPGWSSTGSGVVHNAGGRVGAWLADVLLYAFGFPAYIFPVLLALVAWVIFRERRLLGETTWIIIGLRILGFIMVLATACGLSSMAFPSPHAFLPMDAGGIVGYVLNSGLTSTFNKAGSALILIALLLCGATLFAGVSWVTLARFSAVASVKLLNWTRMGLWFVMRKTKESIQAWLAARKERREQRAQEKPRLAIVEPERPVIRNTAVASPPAPATPKPAPVIRQPEAAIPAAPVPQKTSGPARIKSVELKAGELPPLTLLDQPQATKAQTYSRDKLEEMSETLEKHLSHFGVDAHVVGVEPGPVVTRFEVELAPGMKVSKVSNIDKDLARSLSTASVRVVEVIPGKSVIGIEVPNEHRAFICLNEVLASSVYQNSKDALTMVLGKDIGGHPVIADLAKMPHLLVAGTTGSGKSVSVNAMLLSMLFKSTPRDLRLIMIDPKMLELSIYKDIPHLLTPVVTDMKEAANALRWCVAEMDRRYSLMASFGVRNLESLNQKIEEAAEAGEPLKDPTLQVDEEVEGEADIPPLEVLPNIVVIIDELADMMMVVGKKVEELIARIAQKARAAGIHMILATQRPSVDVITGLIKANIPCRIAFKVSSRIDSRTILDQQGAHQLLGHGDMLYLGPGSSIPVRVHGPFVSDDEIHRVVKALRKCGKPEYLDAILQDESSEAAGGNAGNGGGAGGEQDELYDQAVAIVTETRRASISLVQRRLRIGYNRAANLLEAMEAAGVVSSMQGNGTREVLAPEPVQD